LIIMNVELGIMNEVGAEYIQPCSGKGLVNDVEAIQELPLMV